MKPPCGMNFVTFRFFIRLTPGEAHGHRDWGRDSTLNRSCAMGKSFGRSLTQLPERLQARPKIRAGQGGTPRLRAGRGASAPRPARLPAAGSGPRSGRPQALGCRLGSGPLPPDGAGQGSCCSVFGAEMGVLPVLAQVGV